MNYKCFLARPGEVPPAIRVMVASDMQRATEQLTVWRGSAEDDTAFYRRAQEAADAMSRRYAFARWVYLECEYSPSDDLADDRQNTLRALRHTIDNESDKVDVRLAAIKVMNRFLGLVPAEAGW
jgi:hypothetical protein